MYLRLEVEYLMATRGSWNLATCVSYPICSLFGAARVAPRAPHGICNPWLSEPFLDPSDVLAKDGISEGWC